MENGLDTHKAAFVLIVTDHMKTAEGGGSLLRKTNLLCPSCCVRGTDGRRDEQRLVHPSVHLSPHLAITPNISLQILDSGRKRGRVSSAGVLIKAAPSWISLGGEISN